MRIFIMLALFYGVVLSNNISVESISSDFTQTITSGENETLKYEGNFIASKKDNLAFWNYIQPINKKIYISNSQVIIIEPDLEQAIITTVEQIGDISSIINSAINNKNSQNDTVLIEISNTTYSIFFKDDIPAKITYTDELDNYVVVSLYNTLLNSNIGNDIFNIKIPTNYDIVQY